VDTQVSDALLGIDLLIIDDFAVRAMESTETADITYWMTS
jgi:DNA replication protein DnaC